MSASSLNDRILRWLTGLESAQQDLQTLFDAKRSVLSRGSAAQILKLAEQEARAVAQLRELLKQRQLLLAEAKQGGIAAATLRDLVPQLGFSEEKAVLSRMQRIEQRIGELRREGWGHWIVANRNFAHHSELLELIAHHGKTAPTYSRSSARSTSGGAILDTSV